MESQHHLCPVVACTHYRRNVNLVAPCCNRVVCCHRGHDQSPNGCTVSLDRTRSRVTTVVCMSCRRAQPVANKCRFCRALFARYFCEICLIYTDGPAFHCSACGYCNAARASETRHCSVCNKCYPLSSHRHTCTNFDTQHCAVCRRSMHRSRQRLVTASCGHAMHESCFIARAMVSYSCPHPNCRAPMVDSTRWTWILSSLSRMRDSVRVRVYCNACRRQGTTNFFQGVARCPHDGCHSTNTSIQQPSAPASSAAIERRRRN